MVGASMGASRSKMKKAYAKQKKAEEAFLKSAQEYAATRNETVPDDFYQLAYYQQNRETQPTNRPQLKDPTGTAKSYLDNKQGYVSNAIQNAAYDFAWMTSGTGGQVGPSQLPYQKKLESFIETGALVGIPASSITRLAKQGASAYGAWMNSGDGFLDNLIGDIVDPIADIAIKAVEAVSKPLAKVEDVVKEEILAKPAGQLLVMVAMPYAAAYLGPFVAAALPAGVSAATVAAVSTAVAQTAVAVASGVPFDKALQAGIINGAVGVGAEKLTPYVSDLVKNPQITSAIVNASATVATGVASGQSEAQIKAALSGSLAGSTAGLLNLVPGYSDLPVPTKNVISSSVKAQLLNKDVGSAATQALINSGLQSAANGVVAYNKISNKLGRPATEEEIKQFAFYSNPSQINKDIDSYIESKSVTENQVKQAFAKEGITKLTPQQIEKYVKVDVDPIKLLEQAQKEADTLSTTRDEVTDAFMSAIGRPPTEAELKKYAGETVESDQIKKLSTDLDPVYTDKSEVTDAFMSAIGRAPTEAELRKYVGETAESTQLKKLSTDLDPVYTDLNEVKEQFKSVFGRDPNKDELKTLEAYVGENTEQTTLSNLNKNLDPLYTNKDEVTDAFMSAIGRAPTADELKKYVGEAAENTQIEKVSRDLDPVYTDKNEVTDAFMAAIGRPPTEAELKKYVGETSETAQLEKLSTNLDPVYTDLNEVKEQFKAVFGRDPNEDEIKTLEVYVGEKPEKETLAAQEKYLDPLFADKDEAKEIYKSNLDETPTQKELDSFVGRTEADVLSAITKTKDTAFDMYEKIYGKQAESPKDVLDLLQDISDNTDTNWGDLDKAIEAQSDIKQKVTRGEAYAAARAAFGPNATFEWTDPKTGKTGTYTTESATEKAVRDSSSLITQASSNQKAVDYVKEKLASNIQDPNFNPADLNKKSMQSWVDAYAKATPTQQAAMLKGADKSTFTVIDTLLRQTQQYNPTGSAGVTKDTGDKMIESPVTNYWGVATTGANLAAADLAALGVRGVDIVGKSLGYDSETTSDILKLLDEDKETQLSKLVGYEKSSAGGVASGITSAAAYLSGGKWASVAANTGIAANNAWMEGDKAGLNVFDNSARTAVMATMEMVGETLGIPAMDKIMKGIPLTGGVDAMIAAVKRSGAGLLNEEASELLTTTMQFTADKFANFGLGKESTVEDFAQALKDTVVATATAVGSSGSIATSTNNLNKALEASATKDFNYYNSDDAILFNDANLKNADLITKQETLRGTRDNIVDELLNSGLTEDQAISKANQVIGKEFVNTSEFESGLEETDINQIIGKNSTGQDITLSELIGAAATGTELSGNPVIAENFAQQVLAMQDGDVNDVFKNAVDPYYISKDEASNIFQELGYTATKKELEDIVGSRVESQVTKTTQEKYDPLAVSEAEAKAAFAAEGITNPTPQEIADYIGNKNEQETIKSIQEKYDPTAVSEAEAKAAFAAEGILDPTPQEISNYIGLKNEQETIKSLSEYADPRAFTEKEVKQLFKEQGYPATQQEVNKYVNYILQNNNTVQTNFDPRKDYETTVTDLLNKQYDPLATLPGEIEEIYKEIGYEPTPEEITQFVGSLPEAKQTELARKYGQGKQSQAAQKRRNKYGQLVLEGGSEQEPKSIIAPTADVFYYGKEFGSTPQQISESGEVSPYRPVDMSTFGPDYDAMLGLPAGTLAALPAVQAAAATPPQTGIAQAPNTSENKPTAPQEPQSDESIKFLQDLLSKDPSLTEEDLMKILQERSSEFIQ